MQSFSLEGAFLAAGAMAQLADEVKAAFTPLVRIWSAWPDIIIGAVVALVLVASMASYLVSKVVAAHNAELGRGIRCALTDFLLAVVVTGLAFALNGAMVAWADQLPPPGPMGPAWLPRVILVVIVLLALGALWIAVKVRYKVYDITELGAVILFLATYLLVGVVAGGIGLTTRQMAPEFATNVQKVWAGKAPVPTTVPGKPKDEEFNAALEVARDEKRSLAERKAGLEKVYAQLMKFREKVPTDDAAAMREYQNRREEYESVYQQLLRDAKK